MAGIEANNLHDLLESAAKWMRKRRWHELLGKHSQYTQSLFHHIFVQLNLLVAIRPLLCNQSGFGLSDRQFLALFVGNLCHDVGKEAEAWQEAVRKGERPPDHVHYEETQKAVEAWSSLLVGNEESNSFIATVLAAVGLHHKATQGPASVLDQLLHSGHTDSRWRELADLVEAVDKICSAGTVTEAAAEADRKFGNGLPQRKFDVTFHRVQMLRGVSTTFLHRACQDAHVEKGWTPVLHFADGTLYFALASAGVTPPTAEEIRQKLTTLLDRLLQNANLPQQVVGDPRIDMLPKPELFNAMEFESYLKVAAQRSKPINFQKKHRKRDGSFSEEFKKYEQKYEQLRFEQWLSRRYEKLGDLVKAWGLGQKDIKNWSGVHSANCPGKEADERKFRLEVTKIEPDQLFERFVTAVPLGGMFQFFKPVILSDKLISEEHWPLNETEQKVIEDAVAKIKGDKEEAREKRQAKAKKAALEHWREALEAEYEKEFGKGAFDDLASVTNDPARNLAKAVDYFLEQKVPEEGVQWLSKPPPQQQAELIRRLSKIFQSAVARLPEGVLPPPLDGKRLADVFLGDLLLPGFSSSSNVAEHLEGYLRAKDGAENVLFCPWSNETGQNVLGTGSDFGVATDGHSNRLPMQDKTWKNRGGVGMTLSSRYELMLRRLLLGVPSKQLIALIPPVQLGSLDGRRLVDAVRQLEQEFALHSREFSPNPTRRFSFDLTDQIARTWRKDEDASLATLLSYTSAVETAKGHRKNLDKELQEAFGPSDDGDELSEFNRRHGKDFTTWTKAREDKQLKQGAEAEFLRSALSSLNEECGTSFRTWEELVESIYLGQSDEARTALNTSEEVRERRRLALKFRESGRFVCQTPNLIFVLLPDSVTVGKDNTVNASIRQLFLSLIIANALGASVALIEAEEVLTFSGGEGAVRIPRNTALRSEVSRVRRSWAAMGKSPGVPPTHEWLLPHETESWLNILAAVHYLAGQRLDEKGNTLFPESSALYDVLSARSAGFLARRIENKAKRNVWREEFQTLEILEPFMG